MHRGPGRLCGAQLPGGAVQLYTIAACAATSLLVFQTTLNVLGSVDILPLTGVTFPFVSNGGSSMLSAWTLLAFLKGGRHPQQRQLRHPSPGPPQLQLAGQPDPRQGRPCPKGGFR